MSNSIRFAWDMPRSLRAFFRPCIGMANHFTCPTAHFFLCFTRYLAVRGAHLTLAWRESQENMQNLVGKKQHIDQRLAVKTECNTCDSLVNAPTLWKRLSGCCAAKTGGSVALTRCGCSVQREEGARCRSIKMCCWPGSVRAHWRAPAVGSDCRACGATGSEEETTSGTPFPGPGTH